MVPLVPIIRKAYWSLAAFGSLYGVTLLLLTNTNLQRHAIYVHKFHTAWWDDVKTPESFGFAYNQVTAFNITTPDSVDLFCWHILPLNVWAANEAEICQREPGAVEDFTKTLSYRLLKQNPHSRLVVNYHGNAGHVGQGYRPPTYASISALPDVHVITCDYRGFGHSTGFPTESGLVTDGVAMAKYALSTLGHPAESTILLGQSLGTAVASATTLYFLDPNNALISETVSASEKPKKAQVFAGTVLVASFTNIPELLLSYRIAGLIPVLSPLRPYPRIQKFFISYVVDIWDTSSRLLAAVTAAKKERLPLHLSLLHSRNDPEINWRSSEELYRRIERAMAKDGEVRSVEEKSYAKGHVVRRGGFAYKSVQDDWNDQKEARKVELDIIRYGGHNPIVASAPVAIAVQKVFEEAALRKG